VEENFDIWEQVSFQVEEKLQYMGAGVRPAFVDHYLRRAYSSL
jgi:hypothetical protein